MSSTRLIHVHGYTTYRRGHHVTVPGYVRRAPTHLDRRERHARRHTSRHHRHR